VIFAALRDDFYNVVLLVHILAVLVAFAPAVINPLLGNHLKRTGDAAATRNWAGFTAVFTSRIALPSLVVALLTGVWMIFLSETDGVQAWEFSQAWISLAFLVWFAMAGVISAVSLKGQRQMAAGDTAAEKLVRTGGTVGTALLVVMLYLMIFKPGV
jgi:uncharacterized membrane protein